jgi:hypothetical protein
MPQLTVAEITTAEVRVKGQIINDQSIVNAAFGEQILIQVIGQPGETVPYDLTFTISDDAVGWEHDEFGWDLVGSSGRTLHTTGFVDPGQTREWVIALFMPGQEPGDPAPGGSKIPVATLGFGLLVVSLGAWLGFKK